MNLLDKGDLERLIGCSERRRRVYGWRVFVELAVSCLRVLVVFNTHSH